MRAIIFVSLFLLHALTAHAQAYPGRPVRVLVPIAPGGGMDALTRGLALNLADAFGQSFVVDNRPGAGNQFALKVLAGAAPDGHTLMMVSASTVIYPLLYPSPGHFDVLRDFAPVSLFTVQGYALVVHPALPAKTVMDLVNYAKANPGKLNYSSAGIGSPVHLGMELFQTATGTRMIHVPYQGGAAAYPDLLSGRVDLSLVTFVSARPHVAGGRLSLLAVTPAKRVPAVPDAPTLTEAGVPVAMVNWYGIVAPKGTPKAVLERVAAETGRAVRSPAMAKRLVADGSEGMGTTPAAFADHIRAEQALWSKVVRQAGIRGE